MTRLASELVMHDATTLLEELQAGSMTCRSIGYALLARISIIDPSTVLAGSFSFEHQLARRLYVVLHGHEVGTDFGHTVPFGTHQHSLGCGGPGSCRI